MTCILTWLSTCLIDPSGFYVTADLTNRFTHQTNTEGHWCNGRFCRGYMADLKIGMRVDISRSLELDYGLRHTSFPKEPDRGEEGAYVSVTWRPWR